MRNPMQLSWQLRSRLRMFAIALLLGAAVGIFILYPANEFVYYQEYQPPAKLDRRRVHRLSDASIDAEVRPLEKPRSMPSSE